MEDLSALFQPCVLFVKHIKDCSLFTCRSATTGGFIFQSQAQSLERALLNLHFSNHASQVLMIHGCLLLFINPEHLGGFIHKCNHSLKNHSTFFLQFSFKNEIIINIFLHLSSHLSYQWHSGAKILHNRGMMEASQTSY